MSDYDASFFQYVNASARNAADTIVPLLQEQLQASSVLDVGCGQGAWLAAWRRCGVLDIRGIDGAYVQRSALLFPAEQFQAQDLRREFDLARRFSVVQCLEVAEHLPADAAPALLDSLIRHGDVVLFSAAPPGQGGHGHVNERSYEYWRVLFGERDFAAMDFLRPRLIGKTHIDPWYRYNPLLYVRRSAVAGLAPALRASEVAADRRVPDVSPLAYRIRKQLVRRLPVPVMTAIARVKERIPRSRGP